jgi:hypothetical protein
VIQFKQPELELQFAALPVRLREELEDFEFWSREKGIKAPLVTCILRDEAANVNAGGVKTSLHLKGRAFDLRTIHYDLKSLALVISYWESRRNAQLEVITKKHGNGPHIHVGLREP